MMTDTDQKSSLAQQMAPSIKPGFCFNSTFPLHVICILYHTTLQHKWIANHLKM